MALLPNSFGQQVTNSVTSSALGAFGVSQAVGRQNFALSNYGQRTRGGTPTITYPDSTQDWRVRISLAPNSDYFYNDPNNKLLSPLTTLPGGQSSSSASVALVNAVTGQSPAARVGVIFPYTPQMQITHNANYSEQKLTHTNYNNYFYENSSVAAITIAGDFTIQSMDEGQYLLASIYFFRSLTKMFFGSDTNPAAGNPPPLVYLNGYGQYILPNVPCVVTQFQHTMPPDVDYMNIVEPAVTAGPYYNPQITDNTLNSTRLPTTSSLSITLQPVYSRAAQSQGFSLVDFSRGALVNPSGSNPAVTSFGSSVPRQFAKFPINGGFL